MKILSLLPLAAVSVFAQCSITVTGPANNAVVQSTTLPLTAALASCPAVYRVNWLINGRLYDTAFSNTSLTGSPAWSVLYYPPWPGDGIATVQAIAYDALNNQIAASAVQKFTARTIGSGTALVGSIPTSGSGSTITVSLPLGGGGQMYIDGRQDSLAGCTNYNNYHGSICTLNTTKHRNGLREFWFLNSGQQNDPTTWQTDPVTRPFTFTSANISGNTITAVGNGVVTDHPIVLSTNGTLPTCSGCRASPLQAGAQWYWTGSGQTNTITFTVSSGVATGTCNNACGLSTGDVIDIEGSRYQKTLGLPTGLKGLLTVASSSGPSATTFTISTPNAVDGTYSPQSMVMYTHAYYGISLTNDTFQIAETPGGSAVTITGGGSGTHTENETIYPPYWGNFGAVNNWAGPAPIAFAYQLVDIENVGQKMEMHGFDEAYLCLAGHTTTNCPGTLDISPRGINTDLTPFAITATDCTYTVVPDGGLTGVVSVSSSGIITALSAGWAKVTTASNTGTCTGMATVTTYVKVYAGDANFPTFTHDGHIAASYTAGQSFFPTLMWSQSAGGYQWQGPVMNATGLNTTDQGLNPEFANPHTTGCPSEAAADAAARAFADQYGTFFDYYFGDITVNPWNMAAVLGDYNFDRHTCIRNLIANIKADGRTFRLFGTDELNIYLGGNTPIRPGIVGTTSYFDHITVTGCPGSCLATATVDGSFDNSAVEFVNATNSFLNGLFVPTFTSTDPNTGNILAFTFPIPGASNGTYDKTNNATLELRNFYCPANVAPSGGCTHQAPLPSLAGTGSGTCQTFAVGCSQHWDSVLTSISVSTGVCTVNWTAHALTGNGAVGSNIIQITGATTANLNRVALVTRIGANSFSVPCPGVTGGPFNSGTDSGLAILVDFMMSTNHTFDAVHDLLHSGGDISVGWPILGTTYSAVRGSVVQQWEGTPNIPGNSNIADAAWNYNPNPCLQGGFAYGDDCSLRQSIVQMAESGINTRAWQTEPRASLLPAGGMFVRLHKATFADPANDIPLQLNARPWDMSAEIMYAVAIGYSGFKMFRGSLYRPDQYNAGAGTGTNGGTTTLEHDAFPIKTYNAMALSFNALQRWTKYVLEPRISFESYGPEFYGTARYSTYGGFKLIGSISETPYQQTIRLTNINITGGTMRRECVDGYRFTIAELAGNPTSDTHNFQPGETCAYVSQPAGSYDIDHIPFPPPPSLPFGASKFVVRVGYYPLDRAMDDAPATDCTSGCTIPVNHYNAPAWYQILYLGANNKVLSTLEPQTIAKSN